MPVLRRLLLPATGWAIAIVTGVAFGACGGEDNGTNPPAGDDTPAAIAVSSGDNQTGTAGAALSNPLVVLVTDPDGDPVADVTVTWTILSGGGSLASATSTSNAQGQAQMTYTLGADGGTYTVRAAVAGTTPLSTTFTATAPLADPGPASIEIAGGNGQSATISQPLANPLTARVRNAAGIVVPGIGVTWAVTSGGGSLGTVTSSTNASGIASNTFTVGGTQGASTITATVTSNNSLSVSFTATATAVVNGAVSVGDNVFDPNAVTVSVGGKVTWTWGGAVGHNVTWASGGFTNSTTRTNGTHEVTFNSAGTFTYYCTIHGTPTTGMRGSVTAQ
jgi:plastocyanin